MVSVRFLVNGRPERAWMLKRRSRRVETGVTPKLKKANPA